MLSFPILAALALPPSCPAAAAPREEPPSEAPAPAAGAEPTAELERLLLDAADLERQGDELREQCEIAAQTGRDVSELVAHEVDRYRRAIELYDRAIELRPGDARLYRLRAWARAKHDRDGAQSVVSGPNGVLGTTPTFAPESLADADRAVELAPADPESYLVRARIHALHFRSRWELYSGLSDDDRALAGFLKPDVGSARRALADYARLAELDPERCEAWTESAEIYFLCFKFDRASEMYAKAQECGAVQDEGFLEKLRMVAASPDDFFPRELLEEYDLGDAQPSSTATESSTEAASASRKRG